MPNKTFRSRIKVTKNGKVLRRKMGVGHFRSKKSASSKHSGRKTTSLGYSPLAILKRLL